MTVGELHDLTSLRHNIDVLVPLGGITLEGFLSAPGHSRGIVLVAHGSNSTRHSPHNHSLTDQLYERRLATLLMDLLTPEEEQAGRHLDPELLASRLSGVIGWIESHAKIGNKPLGLFGSSAGGVAALMAATQRSASVKAVVSRGGSPELAGTFLHKVKAPVLLIVGGADRGMLTLNEKALAQLNNRSHLEVIAGATHLFEEPGARKQVAALTASWFAQHLGKAA